MTPQNESNFVFPPPQNIDKIFIPRHIIFLIPHPHPLTIKNIFKILRPQKRFEPKYTCSLYGNIRVNPPPGVNTLPGRKYRVSRSCSATYLATMSYNEPSEHVKSDHQSARQQNAIRWRFACRPIVARYGMLAWNYHVNLWRGPVFMGPEFWSHC